ncbi:hypothetical protein LYSHEL_10410 [Lysobacter helvus]|uniref:DUF3106 domain-containing protein n=2 Tax=Lysobacteraceae TaxID=32033 RepID=A0ABM7Q457_9GAMM|nr:MULTISPECIES: DUF3106 domain-containing protein [Lysobacter]BCT92017.1 hypothetical protein LYSCAS_10410 [Lysobacter caseinilyticus]BCT95170.1 hypothetical protein LYSHEL_10410 [Lysobacter helvus]
MTSDSSLQGGATAAFVRGIERRATLFAELQCGDPTLAESTVAATSHVFTQVAPAQAMADWPARYWGLLLAAPAMRRSSPSGTWPAPWESLATLGNGPRAALLLRLVAVLDMAPAAAALGVSEDTYRAALQRAIPYRDDDTPDRDAWQRWVGEVRARLSGERPVREAAQEAAPVVVAAPLASTQPAAMPLRTPVAIAATPAPTFATEPPRRGRKRIVIASLLAVALASVVGVGIGVFTLRPQWIDQVRGRDSERARVRDLPPADDPVARYDADFAAWTDRDFQLLADPEGLRQAESFPLFAWHAAQLAVAPASDASVAPAATAIVPAAVLAEPTNPLPPSMQRADPLQVAAGTPLPPTAETAIARLPAALQPDLRRQAQAWFAWTAAHRAAFVQRAAQWHQRDPSERARLREDYAAWQRLDAVAVDAIVAAAAHFHALSPMDQSRLQAQFELQDAIAQRGWLLGPAIGADYPRLQPLLAQLPEAQHAPMLRALRRMTAGERADLAVLAQRVPPQGREDLVRTLLSTSDDNRAAWLHARLDQ